MNSLLSIVIPSSNRFVPLDEASIGDATVKAVALATLDDARKKCIDITRQYISLETGVARYEQINRKHVGNRL